MNSFDSSEDMGLTGCEHYSILQHLSCQVCSRCPMKHKSWDDLNVVVVNLRNNLRHSYSSIMLIYAYKC